MKKALISPLEVRLDNNGQEGLRVAAVVADEFPVADPLYWVECPDECDQDKWVYVNGEFVELADSQVDLPEPEIRINTIIAI